MIAFYAPLKSPNHTVPSGDRTMARALLSALPEAELVSELRIYDARGDTAAQDKLIEDAEAEVGRLLSSGANWDAWLTYHNYYKAPDLIGPSVARARGIPYFQVESTRARKRLNGPWARFAHAAEAASDAAHTIFYMTQRDSEALKAYAAADQTIVHLPPFLDQDSLPPHGQGTGPILSVGMMRHRDKLASYGLIAETLARLSTPDWTLQIVGDGPAMEDVRTLMAPFGAQVRFEGQLNTQDLQSAYASAQLLFWPGVNEAFGLSYLEAQSYGVPVVAQDRPGVRDVVDGPQPAPEDGPVAMAERLDQLLVDPSFRRRVGSQARAKVAKDHLRSSASKRLQHAMAGAKT